MGHAMASDSYVRIDEAARNVVRTEIILRRTGKLSMELANAKSIGRCRRVGTRRGTGKKSAGCQQIFRGRQKAQVVIARSVAQPSLGVISRKNATSGSPLVGSKSTCTVFSGRVGWVILIGLVAAASMQSMIQFDGRNYSPPFWHVGSRSSREFCHRSAQGFGFPERWGTNSVSSRAT